LKEGAGAGLAGSVPAVAPLEEAVDGLDTGTKTCGPLLKIGSSGDNSIKVLFAIRILRPVVAEVVAVGAEEGVLQIAAAEVLRQGLDDLLETGLESLVVQPLNKVQDPHAVGPEAGRQVPRPEFIV
jgi:hypothetical protein